MRFFNHISIIIGILAMTALAGCKDDVYEPGKIRPIPPAENPFGEDFKAPDGFDWSMISSVKLNVEVKDEFNGAYGYLIEVFTANPMADETLIPIAAGYARKNANYTTEINVPKTLTRIYLRQTTPGQYKSIYQYTLPDGGGTLDCRLYYTGTSTRSTTTRVSNDNAAYEASNITQPATPDYTDQVDVPTLSDSPTNDWGSGMKLAAGAKFIIDESYTYNNPFIKDIQPEGSGRISIYVKGTWKLSSVQYPFDIYVLPGGKIMNQGELTLGNQTSLFIQKGGTVETAGTFNFQCTSLKNFGTISAASIINNSGNAQAEFYNAGTLSVTGEMALNGITFFNCAPISIPEFTMTDITLVNDSELTVPNSGIHANAGTIFNNGNIKYGEAEGCAFQGNNSTATRIINRRNATFSGYKIAGGIAIYNDGRMEVTVLDSGNATDVMYNACTLIVKNSFTFWEVTLDNGSITAGQDGDGSWKPVPNVTGANDSHFTLKNGSIIKAGTFTGGSSQHFDGKNDSGNEEISMIQAATILYTWTTYVSGNIVIEGTADFSRAGNNTQCLQIATTAKQANIGESGEIIETCSGIINEVPKQPEETPEYPIEVGDATSYTYAFEDQWPVYGDYDMNDVVLTIDEIKLTNKKEGGAEYVKEAKIKGRVKAVGASRTLGIGIQFLGLDNSVNTSEMKQNGSKTSFEGDTGHPTLVICEDVHRYMDPGQTDNTFINTEIGGKTDEDKNFDFSIKFAGQDVKPEAFNISQLDVFIYTQRGAYVPYRREVHVAGYAPTAKADQSYSGASNDNGTGHFISSDNMAWGIRIIGNSWIWPQELVMITEAYDDFSAWVRSGGKTNTDWYSKNYHSDKLYRKN